jgi:hypothetical protein
MKFRLALLEPTEEADWTLMVPKIRPGLVVSVFSKVQVERSRKLNVATSKSAAPPSTLVVTVS